MKLVMDERLKHRLVGLAVIISMAVIFAPPIIKKSNHRFDGKSVASVKLPPKPQLPKIAMPEKSQMFKSVKVAHVTIPSVNEQSRRPSTFAKARFLDQPMKPTHSAVIAKREVPVPHNKAGQAVNSVRETRLVAVSGLKPRVKTKSSVARQAVKATPAIKYAYSVQLAIFSKEVTALALVNKLKEKGFMAYVNKATGKKATIYKVMVGKETGKQNAQKLQKQLATAMRLNGLIISSSGIS